MNLRYLLALNLSSTSASILTATRGFLFSIRRFRSSSEICLKSKGRVIIALGSWYRIWKVLPSGFATTVLEELREKKRSNFKNDLRIGSGINCSMNLSDWSCWRWDTSSRFSCNWAQKRLEKFFIHFIYFCSGEVWRALQSNIVRIYFIFWGFSSQPLEPIRHQALGSNDAKMRPLYCHDYMAEPLLELASRPNSLTALANC